MNAHSGKWARCLWTLEKVSLGRRHESYVMGMHRRSTGRAWKEAAENSTFDIMNKWKYILGSKKHSLLVCVLVKGIGSRSPRNVKLIQSQRYCKATTDFNIRECLIRFVLRSVISHSYGSGLGRKEIRDKSWLKMKLKYGQ